MVTTKDIALLAGVSQTAVSAVLSGQGRQRRISETTSRKILDTAKRLGYRRNLAAQELRRGKSSAIGILLPVPVNNIYNNLTGALGPLLEERECPGGGNGDSDDAFGHAGIEPPSV